MGEADALEKEWLMGRGEGMGETTNYGGNIYGYRDDSESYYLPPDRNDDIINLIKMKTPDQPKRGVREPWLWHAEGTGGWDRAGTKEDGEGYTRNIGGGGGVGGVGIGRGVGGN